MPTSSSIRIRVVVACLVISLLAGCASRQSVGNARLFADAANEARSQHLEAELQQNPSSVETRRELAQIYLQELFFKDAIAQLQEIVRLSPTDIPARQLLWIAYIKSPASDYDKALTVLNDAITVAPERFDLHSNLALHYSDVGDQKNCLAECERALSLTKDPKEQATVYLLMASANPSRFDEYYQQAVRLDPSTDRKSVV